MKSLDDAIQILIAQARRCDRLAVEGVPLGSAFGRVLAEDITSLIDVPAYDNSQMDGYVGVAVEMNNALEPMEVSQRIPRDIPVSRFEAVRSQESLPVRPFPLVRMRW